MKDRIRSLANYLKLQTIAQGGGLADNADQPAQLAFVGNPGTGKTSVARIVGQILGAMGLVQAKVMVENRRSGPVAEFAGQHGQDQQADRFRSRWGAADGRSLQFGRRIGG
ncbi:MAG: AAA family ATPase [Pirellulaceae bacterium]